MTSCCTICSHGMPRYREHILERIEAVHGRKETIASIQKELDELVGSYSIVIETSISLIIQCNRISQPMNHLIQITLCLQTSSAKSAICSGGTKNFGKRCCYRIPYRPPL